MKKLTATKKCLAKCGRSIIEQISAIFEGMLFLIFDSDIRGRKKIPAKGVRIVEGLLHNMIKVLDRLHKT